MERLGETNQTLWPEASEALSVFQKELGKQVLNPQAGDEFVSNFCVAAKAELEKRGDFREAINFFLTLRPEILETPSHALSLTLRGLQKHLMDRQDYPYRDAETWMWAIEEIANPDSGKRHDEFVSDIVTRNVQSNIGERGKALLLVMKGLPDRVPEQPSILDVGCAQNQVLKKMYVSSFYNAEFEEVTVRTEGSKPSRPEIDHGRTDKLNEVISEGIPLMRGQAFTGVGVDIMRADDIDNKRWARACSFYPKELLDKDNVRDYDTLNNFKDVPGLYFSEADFAELEQYPDFPGELPVQTFDVVNFSTMLYQVSPPGRRKMLSNAKELLKPNGIIVVQDFAQVNPSSPNLFKFYRSQFEKPYRYRTFVIDPSKDEVLEIFRWENGRCKSVKLGRDIGRLCLNLPS